MTDDTDDGSAPPEASAAPAWESPGLRRATAVMAVGTGLSRLTGVLRIVALAYVLGAGIGPAVGLSDAYNLANTIPNILHDVVLGGVLSATFVPVFVERLVTRAEDEAWEAISAVVCTTLIVIAVASVVFIVLTPLIVAGTTALNHTAQAGQQRQVARALLWLFVPQLTCYGFISLGTALLNARRRFGAPMWAPIANNVVLIVVLLVFGATVHHATLAGVAHHRGQLIFLGLGTTAGVAAQAAFMVPSLRRAGLQLRWKLEFGHEAVRRILRLSGWTFGLVIANQVALLVVLALSEKVGNGAVSAYTYAYTFFQLPYGVVAVSIMSATAPELAARWATRDLAAFRRRMGTGLRAMLAIVVPAAAGELILAKPLVALVLGHGAAGGRTSTTAVALAMLSLGLPGFCVFLYAVRVLQSVQDLRAAFWLYVLENGLNIALAIALAGPFGVRGIALSISVAYTVAAVAALAYLRSRVEGLGGELVGRPFGHVLLSTAALVLGAVIASNFTASESGFGLFARVVAGTVAGALAYIVAAGALAQLARRRAGTEDGGGPGRLVSAPPRQPRPGDDSVRGEAPVGAKQDEDAGPDAGASGEPELDEPDEPDELDEPHGDDDRDPTERRPVAGPGETPDRDDGATSGARDERARDERAGDDVESGPDASPGERAAPAPPGPGLQMPRWWRSRRKPAPPPRPEPLPPAGRPPRRPSRLGPTRAPGSGAQGRGRLD
ncbi:MAG TPA: murein biosynthesis integral membrane protein MurJ [Acidimicrobiales bacterium]|nr:murein biosynthesis integral membrane protein MurJ [Acidimicrobiales bacterium]